MPLGMLEKNGVETPRMKKSISTTTNHYIQLQLEASNKKKYNLEKIITSKDRRI